MTGKARGTRARLSRVVLTTVLAIVVAGCGSQAPPTAATAATPSPAAAKVTPSPQPAPKLRLGFSAGELVGMSPATLSKALDGYTAAGGSVIRFDINWPRVQPNGPTSWDWSAIDPVVDALAARHLTPLAILDYTPAWARPKGCTSELCEPSNPVAFATFAAAAAKRYAGRGVSWWEVENEQNISWLPAPSPVAYGQLLRETATALHRVEPKAIVLVGGLAPAQTVLGSAYSPADFVAALYALGLRSAFDGIAVHPYSFPSLPGEVGVGGGWQQMLQVREVMVANKDSGKGVWATEFGAPTAGPGAAATFADRRYGSNPNHVDLDLQARTVAQAVAVGRRLPWLRILLWYGLKDLGSDPDQGLQSFGLQFADGTPKPAYAQWQAAVRSLNG